MRTRNSVQGLYTQVAELPPSQSAFLLGRAGGLITFGKALGVSNDELTQLRVGLITTPIGASN